MAHGSCQKHVFLVPKAIFSLVAVTEKYMVLLKVIRLIKIIKYYLEVSVRCRVISDPDQIKQIPGDTDFHTKLFE